MIIDHKDSDIAIRSIRSQSDSEYSDSSLTSFDQISDDINGKCHYFFSHLTSCLRFRSFWFWFLLLYIFTVHLSFIFFAPLVNITIAPNIRSESNEMISSGKCWREKWWETTCHHSTASRDCRNHWTRRRRAGVGCGLCAGVAATQAIRFASWVGLSCCKHCRQTLSALRSRIRREFCCHTNRIGRRCRTCPSDHYRPDNRRYSYYNRLNRLDKT